MQKKKTQKKMTMSELHPKEIALIIALREKFRYGEIVVIMRDGIPFRLKQTVVFDELNV